MVYTSFNTIADTMRECDCIRWKVYDSDENLMRHSNPPQSTQSAQAIETLRVFLDGLAGGGYVLCIIFIRKATEADENGRTKMRKGGDTANSSFSFFYKIGEAANMQQPTQRGIAGGGDMFQEVMKLQLQLLEQKNQFEKNELLRELKELKKENKGSYLETAIEAMAKNIVKEWRATGGGQPVSGVPVKEETAAPVAGNEPAPEANPDKVNAIKRCARSAAKVIATAEKFGGNGEDVAEGFEDFAKLAETNPAKLMEIMQQIKTAASE